MKLLWLFFVLPVVFCQPDFGNSYLKTSRLCHQWTCINTKLGLPDTLPSRNLAGESYRRVLPQGPWQDMLDQVLYNCYENRTRRYTNTCPGQALMHCVVDQMIGNCPEENIRKNDACSTVTTLAGFKDMFTQSIYPDLEKNLPTELRTIYFLKNYFHQKCCSLPDLFSSMELEECGFKSFLNYYSHGPVHVDNLMVRSVQDRGEVIKAVSLHQMSTPTPLAQSVQDNGDVIQAVSLSQMSTPTPLVLNNEARVPATIKRVKSFTRAKLQVTASATYTHVDYRKPHKIAGKVTEPLTTDPLDCCDMGGFIQSSWRSECGFRLDWKGGERLVIANYTQTTDAPVTTTTARADAPKDLMILPHSCSQESCVFRKLGIVDESGTVDSTAFRNLLENFTNAHPSWTKASGKVFTKCIVKKARDYQADCEINRVLACTFDVLTENCPYKMKSQDSCKHNRLKRGCQISSSKLRPKNRREICMLPPLVHHDELTTCDLETLYKPEYVVVTEPKPKRHAWSSLNLCLDQTPSTTCLMNKMGILNKYKFMDYFKMKDRIRQFTSSQSEWSALREIYMSAFINIPMYGEHCSSQKKLLNVVDSMLMTCPVSKRVNSPQCTQLYQNMANSTLTDHEDATKGKIDQMTKHYQHVYLQRPRKHYKIDPVIRRPRPKQYHKPLFYGLVDNQNSPNVDVIHIKSPIFNKDRPLVLAPVYLREPNLSLARPFHRDPMLRSNLVMSPSWVHKLTNRYTTPSSFNTTESSLSDFEYSHPSIP